jgi:hypothetical protein
MTSNQKEVIFLGSVVGALLLVIASVFLVGPINGYIESLDRSDRILYEIAKGGLTQFASKKQWQLTGLKEMRIERGGRHAGPSAPSASVFLEGTKNGEHRFWRLLINGDYISGLRDSNQPISSDASHFDDDSEIAYLIMQ